MKDSLTHRNHVDFKARYQDTFGWLHQDNGTTRFVHLREVTAGAVYFSDGGTTDFHAKANTAVQFEFIPVNRGWFNSDNGEVYFLSRTPARQWKRGICETNTSAAKIATPKLNVRVSFPLLKSIFNGKERTYPVFEGQAPVALSKAFAVSKEDTLYFYDAPIGKYSRENNQFILSSTIFSQELSDLLRRTGSTTTVIVHD